MRAQGKNSALQQLKQILARMAKGALGMRVWIWHIAVQDEGQAKQMAALHKKLKDEAAQARKEHASSQSDLVAQMRSHGRLSAMQQLKQRMARVAKGELGLYVVAWCTAMKHDVRAAQMEELSMKLEGHAAEGTKAVALRQLKQWLARLMRGEVGVRIEVWRQGVRAAVQANYLQVQTALVSQGRGQGQGIGLRQLQQIVTRRTKAELGMRVQVWSRAVIDKERARRVTEMALMEIRVREELEGRAADASRGAGLRLMKQIMTRLGKGEGAMRVDVWRQQMKSDTHGKDLAERRALQTGMEALEAVAKAQGWSIGLNRMKHIMARIVKGDLGMRIQIWSSAVASFLGAQLDWASEQEAVALQQTLEARAADTGRAVGVRLMQQIMGRIMTGELGMRLEVWRQMIRADGRGKQEMIQHALENMLGTESQRAGLNQLKQILARLAKGQVGIRVGRWWKETCLDADAKKRRKVLMDYQDLHSDLVAQHTSLVAQHTSQRQAGALQELRRIQPLTGFRRIQPLMITGCRHSQTLTVACSGSNYECSCKCVLKCNCAYHRNCNVNQDCNCNCNIGLNCDHNCNSEPQLQTTTVAGNVAATVTVSASVTGPASFCNCIFES